ncbi:MAG: hypothetical protein EOR12_31895 [Mesorhizobium sp.]|uniref:hypothetical protein n=1 Tax=Mesorhizobium sp. TaxID=1871066 RepID=UPI000FE5C1DA|nr:hypothetical protein [Mesorhizobium sp.]RWP82605.1 MAG: hypothetical protein EOR12_31895 [Mesorhizobium sp.]
MSDRVGCINPRCRRTFKREHEHQEIICGKCFRMLPEAVRKEHRGFWREIRKWDRRIARTSDELKITRMHAIRDRVSFNLGTHWDVHIKAPLLAPDKPAGLETFLEEVGL